MSEPITKVEDAEVARERVYSDGFYDDGQGTAFAIPDVVAVRPVPGDPEKTTVFLEGGSAFDVEEDPREMAYVVRAWGRARQEADAVLGPVEDREAVVDQLADEVVDRVVEEIRRRQEARPVGGES